MKKIFLFIIFLFTNFSFAQAQNIKGIVSEKNEKGEETPLFGANVLWLGSTKGVSTNEKGEFELARERGYNQLLITYIGFKNDTIELGNQNFIKIILSPAELKTITITGDKDLDVEPIQSELLTTKDLKKAACCNLSESFETNASVDVSTTDAVSGTKQIRMLGLDGVYAQIMTENIPSIRGLSSRSGLYFIPGTWIKSIDINKGAGSVVNGYESITGQINIELAKPENSEKFLLNFYANQSGRLEANLNTAHKISDKWSTALLLHGSNLSFKNDWNDDGFLDNPKFTQVNLINRWKYEGENMEAQLGFKALYDNKTAGQKDFEPSQIRNVLLPYGVGSEVARFEFFSKTGFFFKNKPSQSLGIIFNALHHNQNSFWGLTDYQASQNYLLVNAIYQNEISEKHLIKLGGSLVSDNYDELYESKSAVNPQTFDRKRNELVPGIFAEYTFNPNPKFTAVGGIRSDFHNLYGTFLSPRLHLKYHFSENTILRASGGRGFRVANPIVESFSYQISSRVLTIANELQPEIAWNYGGSLSQAFKLGGRKGTIIADFYRTDFINQIITDLDSSPDAVSIYNLTGSSFANSFQISMEYELFERFDIHTAYKYYQVRSTIGGELRDLPFIPKDRFFVNLGYSTPFDKWQFDLTAEWFGKQRLPDTSVNPQEFQRPLQSPSYLLLNAQITRAFKTWEVYMGGENLGNYMQQNPIVDAQNPFGENFDAGMIYAPIMGRQIYAGLRFTLK